jgi:malate dehydrogenase (oxaloacetate-decarboxylating)(NADP+)
MRWCSDASPALVIADTTSTSIPRRGGWPDRAVAPEIAAGITPKVALLSHSSFGSSRHPQATKMQEALALVSAADPALEVEGEMHGDAALDEEVRLRVFPNSRLKGEANLLVMPTVDAANIAFNLLKASVGGGVTLGPMLLGVAKPVHILTPSATVRRIVNMTALVVADVNAPRGQEQNLF